MKYLIVLSGAIHLKLLEHKKRKQGRNIIIYIKWCVYTAIKHCFIYIKELVLQAHNLRMYLNHQALSNIHVYSVKTDAFTVDTDKMELAKSLITLDNTMGSRRVSSTDDIAYPRQQVIKQLEYQNTYSRT